MDWTDWLGGILITGAFIFLTVALLKPEWFQ